MSEPNIVVCEDRSALNAKMAQLWTDIVSDAIFARGRAMVALSGGSTPKSFFELLAAPEWAKRTDWSTTHIFWGDERVVPADHPDSNYRMAREALLSRVPVPENNVHRVPTESGTPEQVAALYEQTLRQQFGKSPSSLPEFDLNLLGLGENGHTASLFPHTAVLHDSTHLVAGLYIEEVKMNRITMTAPLINNSRELVFLVSGAGKAAVVHEVLRGASDPERLPAQLIKATHGRLTWLLDKPAAAQN